MTLLSFPYFQLVHIDRLTAQVLGVPLESIYLKSSLTQSTVADLADHHLVSQFGFVGTLGNPSFLEKIWKWHFNPGSHIESLGLWRAGDNGFSIHRDHEYPQIIKDFRKHTSFHSSEMWIRREICQTPIKTHGFPMDSALRRWGRVLLHHLGPPEKLLGQLIDSPLGLLEVGGSA